MKKDERTKQESEPDFFSVQVAAARRFYRNLNPSPNDRLVLIAGGRETCAPGYKITRQNFPFYGIEFVVGGCGQVILNKQAYELKPGALFGYGPKTNHAIYSDQIHPLEKYFIDLAGRKAREQLMACGILENMLQTADPAAILNTFEELCHYGLSHTFHGNKICAQLIELLVLKISDTALTVRDASSPAFATYQRCRNEINTNYKKLRSLTDVADHCHIDSAYLCRLFQRYDRQSPHQYLLHLRMNHAAHMLLEPGAMVKNVADALDFEDPYHFSRTFKKILGISPAHFGKTHQTRPEVSSVDLF